MSVAAVVVAAGSGERLGAGRPKALVNLGNQTILDWCLSAFSDHPDVDEVIVVAPATAAASLAQTLPGPVVPGGRSRSESVQRGLAAVSPGVQFVLVHDAARPLVPSHVISGVVAALRAGADAVIPVLPMVDTVKEVDHADRVVGTPARDSLRRVQTPQGFRLDVLRAAYAAAPESMVTDDAGVAEAHGICVVTVAGDDESFKITTPHDLRIAELLVHQR